MSERCRHETHVIRAVADDQWTDALREHVASCADCAATAAAAPFMKRLARLDERQQKLPDPAVVWLKAQLLRGSAIAERATRPITIAQLTAYLVVAGGWAAVLTWKWADLQRWLLSFTPTSIVQGMTHGSPMSVTFLLVVVILASMTVMVALHTILAED